MTALLMLFLAAPALAAVELEARLTPPAGATSPAAGLANLTLEDDGLVRWRVQVRDMTGFATATEVRVRDDDRVVVTLTNPPPTGTHVGTFGPLDDSTRDALYGGRLDVVVATAAHSSGELRGPIALAVVPGVTCACAGGSTPAFHACVRRQLAAAPSLRRSLAGRRLRAAVRRAVCGTPERIGRRQSACCLPRTPDGNVVVESLCAQRSPTACRRMRGVLRSGARCAPAVCGP